MTPPPSIGNYASGIQNNNNSSGQQFVGGTFNGPFIFHEVTDPRHVKTNIHETRGNVLKESYEWILHHSRFQSWRDDNHSQVLWVKGDPGKGKTMLLCGIIDELRPTTKLEDSQAKTCLSFFFCQGTDPKLSNACAVLRGLIYMLVKQQPSLLSHAQERFMDTGEPHFGEAEAWAALCNMFLDILRDPSLDKIYIVVDALDECVQDQDKLLRLILKQAKGLPRRIRLDDSQSILSLELQDNAESVALAIKAYITNRIAELESLQDDDTLLEYVQQILQRKAGGTFLWVAVVVQELEHVDSWKVRKVVNDVLGGLDDLYARMIEQIERMESDDMNYCRLILSATALAYRPLQLLELGVVSELPHQIAGKPKYIETLIKRSGSFLTVRDRTIYFVHQSAKDYLVGKGKPRIFPSGDVVVHRRMFRQSLQVMQQTLRRDMYSLRALGTHIDQAQPPDSDPLAIARGTVDTFLQTQCLYWLEALSLLRSMADGIMSIQRLRDLLMKRSVASRLSSLVQDTYRFILYHRAAIENYPLQAYGCGLVFSPSRSMIQELFRHERPKGITRAPAMGDDWDAHTGACLQTLEGHDSWVRSVVFSHDSSRVASGSRDKTIKIWDAHTGACLQTLEGHDSYVTSVVFSHDSSRVASGSRDKTIKIWDAHTGACLQTVDIGSAIFNLSSDATGFSLYTDTGIIALRDSPTPAPTPSTAGAASDLQSLSASQPPQTPEYRGYGISSDSLWITWQSQNWLWLPPMYRPICSAVGQSGLELVLGCRSGRVLIFRFADEDRS
ncbi:Vegetative incompatibility protein HET-E-1 [Penicillium odoratum]|uniref:Vegetative incompatibility protein HET-E-1 n=1 Tax=Penicillium odoratum TaxID=1167516 RepID=UPI00254828CD|nr:Vegetative incompatibility protein HET-E-1 [Penicillium odoratum]KAJ5778418.1 Vegetative incompatibility protein HET-E-1 [Penicillium odoratum]